MADNFKDAIRESDAVDPLYMDNRREIVEYYQKEYFDDWRKHIVDDMQSLRPEMKRSNIAREFQYDKKAGMERWEKPNVTSATREKYELLGYALPEKGYDLRGSGVSVTLRGTQNGKEREITVRLSGGQAQQWINRPNASEIYRVYGVNPAMWEEDGSPHFDIEDIEVN